MKTQPMSMMAAAALTLSIGARAGSLAGQSPPTLLDTAHAPHLRGHVIDLKSHAGIPNAQVILDADGRFVSTDSTGAYDLAAVPKGLVELSVRAPSFAVAHYTLQLIGTGSWVQELELDSTRTAERPVRLAAVPITAPARTTNYRLQAFELRRRSGRGQYLTDDEIRASGASNIQDAVRNMHGVTLDCGGTLFGGCRIRMIGSPARCLPEYYVDGQVDNEFGPLTPIRDVVALELYTGPADVPGDFAGSASACGVVVLWTRSGPDRRSAKEPPESPPADSAQAARIAPVPPANAPGVM